jgi:two-component system phosphate regulon sensor histidine kinase PhoR
MSWLIRRALGAVLAMLAGALLGLAIGTLFDAAALWMSIGAAAGVFTVAATDAVRGGRLIRWLHGTQQSQPPRDSGFWGELAYRVERSLRVRA